MRLVLLLLLLAPLTVLTAADGNTVDGAITRFEDAMAKEFAPIGRILDSWRAKRANAALVELQGLLGKATPEDQVVIAYHLLAAKPTHKQARELFTKSGLTPPFDDKGVAAPGWSMPATSNRVLADKIANLTYPPFDVVREAIDPKSPTVSGFWKRQEAQREKLKTDLVELAKQGQAEIVYPLLAYYHPQAVEVRMFYQTKNKPVPKQRTWLSPVDQWLLDHELAGIDCLSPVVKPTRGNAPALAKGEPAQVYGGSWDFPVLLSACRIECAATWTGRTVFLITDERSEGIRLVLQGSQAVVETIGGKTQQIGDFKLDFDPTTVPMPLQFEVRGTAVTVRVGGVIIGTGALPKSMAFKRVGVEGSLRATQLRLRYLANQAENALLTGETGSTATVPVPPAEPAWKAERTAQLSKTVSFVFADTSLEEVASMLSRLSGTTFVLDASAEPLKDLPVSLNGDDLKLQTALEWLQRLTDVEAVPTEQGFSLKWKG